MITAKDVYERNGLNSEIFDEFIKAYVIPQYDRECESSIKIYYSDWSRKFDAQFYNGNLVKALELRGFSVEYGYDEYREKDSLIITIPPQGE